MLGSAVSYADDVNIFLRNRWDNQLGGDTTKSQVLFLIDVVAGNDTPTCHGTYTCYAANDDGSINTNQVIDCDEADNSDNNYSDINCGSECFDARSTYFQMNNVYPGFDSENVNANHLNFTGCFCPNDSSNSSSDSDGYWKVEDCDQAGVIDVRPVIQKVMQQRPDIKYGVMALNGANKNADVILPLVDRDLEGNEDPTEDGSAVQAALYHADFPKLKHPTSDTAVFPTLGGMQSVESYLSGDDSPLTNKCTYTQLVVITNGGWKNDVDNDPSSPLTTLTQQLANNVVKSGCDDARVATSVIGINVPEDDNADYPLFYNGDSSVAATMASADNGKGIYLNSKPDAGETDQAEKNKQIGTGILNAVLDIIDYSYEDPAALITPVAPVSISRGQNLNVLYASSFKAQAETAWPGNITKKSGGAMPGTNFDSSAFSFPDTRIIKTVCNNDDGAALCDLSVDGDISAEDIAWLKGLGGMSDTDILGDIVHFRPLPIHMGDLDDGATAADPDIDANELYVVVGTNRGLLHIFDGAGEEKWAFLPPQLKPMISALRQGYIAPAYNMVNHFYGVDGAPSVFIYDAGRDGKINPDEVGDIAANVNDKILLYFGLRRGGAGYFAFNITDPASPDANTLLWQIGGSDLDYGDKPDAAIVLGESESDIKEKIDPKRGGSGGCPVFNAVFYSGALPSHLTDAATCLSASKLKGNCEQANVSTNLSGIYATETIYFKEMVGSQAYFTLENKCIPTIDKSWGEYTFDAHVGAWGGVSLTGTCLVGAALNDQAAGTMKKHTGLGPGGGSAGEVETLAGFVLNGLPDDITITDASITFAHTGHGNTQEAINIYSSGVDVYASGKGYYGSSPRLDGTIAASNDDCRDNTHFTGSAVATIKMPANGSIALGSRTTDGVLNLSTEQLTDLFINNRHDDDKNHSWVQFMIKRRSTASNENIYWGKANEGPTAANYEGDGYWDKVSPRLTLKWCVTGSDAEGGCDHTGPTDPELTIKIEGSGSVSIVDDDGESETCTSDLDPCTYIYDSGTSLSITANANAAAGYTFNSLTGCTPSGNSCTVIMDTDNTVTANFVGAPKSLSATVSGLSNNDVVNVMAYIDGGTNGVDVTDANLDVSSGSAVRLVVNDAAATDTDGKQLTWSDLPSGESCDAGSETCEFTMPAAITNISVKYEGSACSELSTPMKCSQIFGMNASDGNEQTLTGCDVDSVAATMISSGSNTYECDNESVASPCTIEQTVPYYSWFSPSISSEGEYGYEQSGKYYTNDQCTQ